MIDEDSLRLAREWVAAINAHDPDRLAATLADDFTWELGESSTKGRDISRQAWQMWFEAFPDLHFEIVATTAQGSKVATQLMMSGTHLGEFRFRGTGSMLIPISPSRRHWRVPGCAVHEMRAGKIAHLWAYWDTATLLRQIGVLPPLDRPGGSPNTQP